MIHNYEKEDKLLAAVDCIIFGFDQDALKLLLIKRNFEPKKGSWSLMGGFLKKNETLNQAGNRVLETLTGLKDVFMAQLRVFSQIERDSGERTISVPYYALINIRDHNEALIKTHSAEWFKLTEKPDLIFDHNLMVTEALEKFRREIFVNPIVFELLPPKFTMRQLLKLYEAILGHELDNRNFIKKINSMKILKKLNEKEMSSSKKGSFLYEFDSKNFGINKDRSNPNFRFNWS